MIDFKTGLTIPILLLNAIACMAPAQTIDNAAFFDSTSHTFVDFETNGNGDPITLENPRSQILPADEYASTGFVFNMDLRWANDSSPNFDASQAIGGSPEITISPDSGFEFEINFSTPVRAFGFWVTNNNIVAADVTFEALSASSEIVESVTFSPEFVDGSIGNADYGFMGISSNAGIASVRITDGATTYDNFYFSPVAVPEPSTASFLMLCFCGSLTRRPKRLDKAANHK